jgi:hypothetical protein
VYSGQFEGRLPIELLPRGTQPTPLEREPQAKRRAGPTQHALEPRDEQRELVEIDARLLEREAAGGARGRPAAARVGAPQQQHRERERVVEDDSLDVGGRSDGDQRVADRERATEAALRRSGASHEHMFAWRGAMRATRYALVSRHTSTAVVMANTPITVTT